MNMKTNTASNIFQIRDGNFSTLPEHPMRQGFYGETLEAALQRLLVEHPEVMPGDELVSDGEEAPRFLLLRREAAVGSWSLDHLFVDQFGIPTLVECKLIENNESRREVVGQIIEYAANARSVWAEGQLRKLANGQWSSGVSGIDALLESELGVEDVDEFWQKVDNNLESGRIRLIIAGDHINSNVKRMIEYLNSEMRNTEVYGLEINCYGPDSSNVVMMTRVVGRVQAVADKRAAQQRKRARRRDVSELRDYFSSLENSDGAAVAIALLDWSLSASRYLAARTVTPSFKFVSHDGNNRLGVYAAGDVWVLMNDLNDDQKQLLHSDLMAMGVTQKSLDGKNFLSLEKLTQSNVNKLIAYLDEH